MTADIPVHPRQGYFLEPIEHGVTHEFNHVFCGSHSILGAWCHNCDKPLIQVASLDTSDARLELQDCPSRQLPLLICWSCEIAHRRPLFFYELQANGVIEQRHDLSSCPDDEEGSPYENYPVAFPARLVNLLPVSDEHHRYMLLHWMEMGPPSKGPRREESPEEKRF